MDFVARCRVSDTQRTATDCLGFPSRRGLGGFALAPSGRPRPRSPPRLIWAGIYSSILGCRGTAVSAVPRVINPPRGGVMDRLCPRVIPGASISGMLRPF